ncbi:MAG: DUF268 domain-containing protein [Anaerolineae bacterium]|nr:DUF268 domain-containing protein [Anaerolineae bacterium]
MLNKWLLPLIDIQHVRTGLQSYWNYMRNWQTYTRMPGAESLSLKNAYPCLHDRTSATGIDAHYFYQGVWAFRQIEQSGVQFHVDVGSQILFSALLSSAARVVFVDIRPAKVRVENFSSVNGSILALPFDSNTVHSLSCLHVAEHIGLGRYGDPLDPHGTIKAIGELVRVLAPGGNLYFSLPIGKTKVCYNAHRIHSPQQIMDYFHPLQLVDFAVADDDGVFQQGIEPGDYTDADYACGMFRFRKRGH